MGFSMTGFASVLFSREVSTFEVTADSLVMELLVTFTLFLGGLSTPLLFTFSVSLSVPDAEADKVRDASFAYLA